MICEQVVALLDSTALRTLTPKERSALALFCAARQIPVISREDVSCDMVDAAEKVKSDIMKGYVSEGHELSYPSSPKLFHGLLLEAKKLQALAEAQDIRRLVGICLLMPCLVTSVVSHEPSSQRPLRDGNAEQAAQAPAGRRARLDMSETEASRR